MSFPNVELSRIFKGVIKYLNVVTVTDCHTVYATPTSILTTYDVTLQSVKLTIKANGIELSNWMNTKDKMQKAYVLTDCLLYGV